MTDEIESDALWHEVAAILQEPQSQWPKVLLHYTKLSSFQKIAESKSILLFNALSMNDRQEILEGVRLLTSLLKTDQQLQATLKLIDKQLPQFSVKFQAHFDTLIARDAMGSYVFCLSKPDPQHSLGSLSMWRAYGADGAGICLQFNAALIAENYTKVRLPFVLYPVRYETAQDFENLVRLVLAQAAKLASRLVALWSKKEDEVLFGVYQLLLIAVATHKHPGFREEGEWRTISFASFNNHPMLSKVVVPSDSNLRLAFGFKLDAYARAIGATIDQLLHSVIIGPSDRQAVTAGAVEHLLDQAGVKNPLQRILFCDTPYRASK